MSTLIISVSLADLGGGVRDARPPLGVQILSISCSFRENLACSRPPWRVHAPPRENPGSATVSSPSVALVILLGNYRLQTKFWAR